MSSPKGEQIGVEALFRANGKLFVRRIQLDGGWVSVTQGRGWRDDAGRHLLIMLPGGDVHQLTLNHNGDWLFIRRNNSRQTA